MTDTPEIAALRERFEKWAIFIFRTVILTKSGVYADYETQLAWEAFKEGAKTPPAEPVPSLAIAVRALEKTKQHSQCAYARHQATQALKEIESHGNT